jgi:hypothetical protein
MFLKIRYCPASFGKSRDRNKTGHCTMDGGLEHLSFRSVNIDNAGVDFLAQKLEFSIPIHSLPLCFSCRPKTAKISTNKDRNRKKEF